MRRLVLTLIITTLFGLLTATPHVFAADANILRTSPAARALPFPRSEQAQAVWNERTCWSQCGAYCAWGMAECLQRDAQGMCLARTDTCDRTCQRECRTLGGPYLNLAN